MQIIKKRILLIATIFLAGFLLQLEVFAEDARLPGNNQGEQAQDYFKRGHRFYLESKSTQSEAEFKKALQLNPALSDAHYYLASIYFKQDRYEEAIEHCEQALRLNPEDLKSLIILGLSFQGLGLNDRAINRFQKACEIDTQSAAAHSALGLAYCAKGDTAKAKEAYNSLRQIDLELASDLLQRIKELE